MGSITVRSVGFVELEVAPDRMALTGIVMRAMHASRNLSISRVMQRSADSVCLSFHLRNVPYLFLYKCETIIQLILFPGVRAKGYE